MHTIKEVPISKIKTVPVPSDIKEAVKNTLWQYLEMGRKKFGRQFLTPSISFDLRGKVAGMAYPGKNHIQLNAILLLENFDDFLSDTVPHELAHLITRALYKGKVASHGPEWKLVMRTLGVDPQRCHSYDVTNARTQKTHPYLCACEGRTLSLSTRQHNKAQKGVKYTCKTCKAAIRYAAHLKDVSSAPPKPVEDAPSLTKPANKTTPATLSSASSGGTEPPTEKQLAYARYLASKKRTTIPLGALVCKTQMSRWITAHA